MNGKILAKSVFFMCLLTIVFAPIEGLSLTYSVTQSIFSQVVIPALI